MFTVPKTFVPLQSFHLDVLPFSQEAFKASRVFRWAIFWEFVELKDLRDDTKNYFFHGQSRKKCFSVHFIIACFTFVTPGTSLKEFSTRYKWELLHLVNETSLVKLLRRFRVDGKTFNGIFFFEEPQRNFWKSQVIECFAMLISQLRSSVF